MEDDNEMSKYDLIATLIAIREYAKQNGETKTVELIETMIKEMKEK